MYKLCSLLCVAAAAISAVYGSALELTGLDEVDRTQAAQAYRTACGEIYEYARGYIEAHGSGIKEEVGLW